MRGPRLAVMFEGGGLPNRINAQFEAERLAAVARGGLPVEEDPADERAERITNDARTVVGTLIGAVIVIGGLWVFSGSITALVAAAAVAMVVNVFVVIRRVRQGRRP